MSKGTANPSRRIGLVLLLVCSEALGILFGEWSTRLSKQVVPQMFLSQFNEGAAHITFLIGGTVMGLAIFLFSLAAIFLSRFFGNPAPSASAS